MDNYAALITILAIMQLLLFAMLVGKARVTYGIKAPAVSGDPNFERYHRVQQNSLENLVIFLPALWIFNQYWDSRLGAGLGLVYVLSRFWYLRSYISDPKSRGKGFILGFLCEIILMLGALIGVVMAMMNGLR